MIFFSRHWPLSLSLPIVLKCANLKLRTQGPCLYYEHRNTYFQYLSAAFPQESLAEVQTTWSTVFSTLLHEILCEYCMLFHFVFLLFLSHIFTMQLWHYFIQYLNMILLPWSTWIFLQSTWFIWVSQNRLGLIPVSGQQELFCAQQCM